MATPFDSYARTARGRRLSAIINDPARYPEYVAFSREGLPAVRALLSLVRRELDSLRRADPREFAAAKQFVGWAVAQVMRQHGHQIIGRSRVPGRLFTMGAVWSGAPGPRLLAPPSPLPRPYLVHQHRAEILAPGWASGA
jgi:hypothetical protein